MNRPDGAFEPDESRHLPAERGGVAGLACEQVVDADAGGVRPPAFGVQREAGDGAGRRRAAPFAAGEPAVVGVLAGRAAVESEVGLVRAGPGAVVEALVEEPLVGALGARVGGEAGGGDAAQREERLHGDDAVALGARQRRRRACRVGVWAAGSSSSRHDRPRPVGLLVGEDAVDRGGELGPR